MFVLRINGRYISTSVIVAIAFVSMMLCDYDGTYKTGSSVNGVTRIYPVRSPITEPRINKTTPLRSDTNHMSNNATSTISDQKIVSVINDTGSSYSVIENVSEDRFNDSKLSESSASEHTISDALLLPSKILTKSKLNNEQTNFSAYNGQVDNGSFKAPEFDNKPFVPSFPIPSVTPKMSGKTSQFNSFYVSKTQQQNYQPYSQPVIFEQFYHPDKFFAVGKKEKSDDSKILSTDVRQPVAVDYRVGNYSPSLLKNNHNPDNRVYYQSNYDDYEFGHSKNQNLIPSSGNAEGERNFVRDDYWFQSIENDKNKFPSLKPTKKTPIMHALSTLIPLMLLLAAIPPNVVVLNNTELQKKVSIARSDTSENDLPKTPIGYLVEHLDAIPSNEQEDCNKRYLCEQALKGSNNDATFSQYSTWLLLSRSMKMVQEKLNLSDVADAIKRKDCRLAFKSCIRPILKRRESHWLEDEISSSGSRSK